MITLASQRPSYSSLLRHPASFLATLGGLGLIRWAPGTFGSLAALPLYLALAHWLPAAIVPLWWLLLVLGWWSCGACARYTGVKDPGFVVIDETLSLMAVLHFLPASPLIWLLAFVIFRIYDILKPWPISYLDTHLSGGTGIMVDDLAAALATGLTCHLLLGAGLARVLPSL